MWQREQEAKHPAKSHAREGERTIESNLLLDHYMEYIAQLRDILCGALTTQDNCLYNDLFKLTTMYLASCDIL